MYQIYYQETADPTKKPQTVAFSDSVDDAKRKLKDSAVAFITEHEGTNKLATAFQENETKLADLPNGFYFVNSGDTCMILKKKTEKKVTVSGWVYNSEVTQPAVEDVRTYDIAGIKRDILDDFLVIPAAPDMTTSDKQMGEFDLKAQLQSGVVNELISKFEQSKQNIQSILTPVGKRVIKQTSEADLERSKRRVEESRKKIRAILNDSM
jgi:hypothetical protein